MCGRDFLKAESGHTINIYRVCFENKQMISEKKGYFECEIDDCGKIYTQQGSYRMIGDFSGVLTLLDGLF